MVSVSDHPQILVEVVQMQIGWKCRRHIEMVDGFHIVRMHSCTLAPSLNKLIHELGRLLARWQRQRLDDHYMSG